MFDHIIKILEIIIWPSTILIIVFNFKNEIVSIIHRLSNFKYKNFEAKFTTELKSVKEKAELIKTEATFNFSDDKLAKYKEEELYKKLIEISKVSARASVIAAWIEIETALLHSAESNNIYLSTIQKGILNILNVLCEYDLISNNTIQLFEDLWKLRNEAVHAPDYLTENDARLYIDLAVGLIEDLKYRANRKK